jgi:hypothetical protein
MGKLIGKIVDAAKWMSHELGSLNDSSGKQDNRIDEQLDIVEELLHEYENGIIGIPWELNLVPAVKAGRCFNGFEKDRGTVVHAVPPLPNTCVGDWFTMALCGVEPGRRGNGWSKAHKGITCPNCLKRLEQWEAIMK